MVGSIFVASTAVLPLLPFGLLIFLRFSLFLIGHVLKISSHGSRETIYLQYQEDIKQIAEKDERSQQNGTSEQSPRSDWTGVIGFFHPFCNAGGGGERVLWAAIAANQKRYPRAMCVVYTGDHEIDVPACVAKVKDRFDINLREHTLGFVYLSKRHWVLASTWPHFTLLGQSLGSLVLTFEALSILSPDIFIDTMGYAFGVALCKYLFPSVPTAAYVHYPTISTDMLESLDDQTGIKGLNSGQGVGWKGKAKKVYWQSFAWIYGWVGSHIDVVMCNSTWTSNHITQLWFLKSQQKATIVYPPCPVEELKSKIKVDEASEPKRENIILYIAQFRPEKNHSMILRAFSKHYLSTPDSTSRLVLIGSVRSNTPDEKHVYSLRLLARELKIQDVTTFICDAPFSTILEYLQKSNISVNGMYNEHFGIGNVEGLAAGLIPVVHDSGGPKLDIVIPYHGEPVGFRADNEDGFAEGFGNVDRLDSEARLAMRIRGRRSAERFTEEVFCKKWDEEMDKLVRMTDR